MPSRALEMAEAKLQALVARSQGQRLPSERELARRFGIGRVALRALLSSCESRQLIVRRHGSGTYAVDPQLPRLGQVAVIVDHSIRLGSDPFFAAVIEALQQELQTQGVQCQLLRYRDGDDPPPAALHADAALLLGSACGTLLGRWSESIPLVAWLIAGASTLARCSVIDLEDEAAGAAAVEYLLGHGCQRVLFIGHDLHPSPRRRLAGARAAASARGIPLSELTSGMNYEDGVHAAALVCQQETIGVGVIAANDWLACGVQVGLQMRGCTLPVIGFDGLPQAQALGLPSLVVPIQDIARDAITELRRLSATPAAPGRRLCYRLTLGPGTPPSTG